MAFSSGCPLFVMQCHFLHGIPYLQCTAISSTGSPTCDGTAFSPGFPLPVIHWHFLLGAHYLLYNGIYSIGSSTCNAVSFPPGYPLPARHCHVHLAVPYLQCNGIFSRVSGAGPGLQLRVMYAARSSTESLKDFTLPVLGCSFPFVAD